MIKNRISLFLATFLIIGFFFLALPEKGYSGMANGSLGCCQLFAPDGPDDCTEPLDPIECNIKKGEFIPHGVCSSNGIDCIGPVSAAVPTLSEWGLIAMASILGLVGFIVIRRRKATV